MGSKENPENPKLDLFNLVKIMPKWWKSTECDQNVISWKGGPDTSACQILGHSSHAFGLFH